MANNTGNYNGEWDSFSRKFGLIKVEANGRRYVKIQNEIMQGRTLKYEEMADLYTVPRELLFQVMLSGIIPLPSVELHAPTKISSGIGALKS